MAAELATLQVWIGARVEFGSVTSTNNYEIGNAIRAVVHPNYEWPNRNTAGVSFRWRSDAARAMQRASGTGRGGRQVQVADQTSSAVQAQPAHRAANNPNTRLAATAAAGDRWMSSTTTSPCSCLTPPLPRLPSSCRPTTVRRGERENPAGRPFCRRRLQKRLAMARRWLLVAACACRNLQVASLA